MQRFPEKAIIGLPAIWLLVFLLVSAGLPSVSFAEPPPVEDLNYGFFMVRTDEQFEALPSVHARWVRMAGVAVWGLVEATPGSGVYDFSETDGIVQEANDLNLQLLLTVNQRHPLDPGAADKALPTDLPAYKAFVQAFAERYDGDGISDAPSSPVVKYWQVGNEPDNENAIGEKLEWDDTPQNYALFLKESSEAIHLADPTAVVLIGGLARGLTGLAVFYEAVFTSLDGFGGGPFFDVFDVHWFGLVDGSQYRLMETVVDDINVRLTAHSYGDIPIWMTETATYSGTPDGFLVQTEEEQARDLAKRLLHFRNLDIDKVFWTPHREFHNWKDIPNGYFDNTGLINNPLNDGSSSKKKAYFSYRFLTSKLDGAAVQIDSPVILSVVGGGIFGAEFRIYDRTYYAFWIDNPALVGSVISFATSFSDFTVYILMPDGTNSIPSAAVSSVGGFFSHTLGLDPILIEHSGDGPPLAITAPVDGLLTMNPSVNVIGTTDALESVLLEGPYGVSDQAGTAGALGNFAFVGVPLSEGDNPMNVTVGTGGNTRSATVHVALDTVPSELAVTFPEAADSLNTPAIEVEGVADMGQLVVFQNPPSGSPVSAFAHEVNGFFLFPVETFPEGLNSIVLTAVDAAGNTSATSVNFRIDTQPPQILGMTVWSDTGDTVGPYEVQAAIGENDALLFVTLAYTLNGGALIEVPMPYQGGNLFRGEIPGQPPGTSITYYVRTRDVAGNTTTEPPPADPHRFRISETNAPVITGTSELADTNNTVTPYTVTTHVSDDTAVGEVTLFYKIDDGLAVSVPMADLGGGSYGGQIPAQPLLTIIAYWIRAEDVFGNFSFDPATIPSVTYWFRVTQPGTADVLAEVTPVSNSVPRGGSLRVQGSLYNFSLDNQTINLKIIVTLPNFSQITLTNVNVPLTPIQLIERTLTHPVPLGAPVGTYTYSAVVSTLGGTEMMRDEFLFGVTN